MYSHLYYILISGKDLLFIFQILSTIFPTLLANLRQSDRSKPFSLLSLGIYVLLTYISISSNLRCTISIEAKKIARVVLQPTIS
jgi:hypothetical protein